LVGQFTPPPPVEGDGVAVPDTLGTQLVEPQLCVLFAQQNEPQLNVPVAQFIAAAGLLVGAFGATACLVDN
jgi:hypothetical protein